MALYRALGCLAFLAMQLPAVIAECPLDLSRSNYTLVASICYKDGRAKCCRYINACIAVSVASYANRTRTMGVASDLALICLQSIEETLELYGVPRNATAFCGLGTKITVNYECMGRTTVTQMMQAAGFHSVSENCGRATMAESSCRKCVNAGIVYLRHLTGTVDNITLSTCRDAAFVALASQFDGAASINFANCFFGVEGIIITSVSNTSQPPSPSYAFWKPPVADGPSQLMLGTPLNQTHHSYHLTLVPGLGIAVMVLSVLILVILLLLIRRTRRELEVSEDIYGASSKVFPPIYTKKIQEGQAFMFYKFSYRETKKATENFSTVIGKGGFGTVYRARFSDDSMAAVKRMNRVSEQGEDDFCREMELLARLHHRHLVALKGFCVDKHERFLIYEYMINGSLKDHLHSPERKPLSWRMRIQIAIDVANALEYLHFYCDPPLCHRDIKSSNIMLDDNFVAKVADFGLTHASKDGSICFEPVNTTDNRGTPGHMDPEYVITQELTKKSDVYSYGVLLLEMVTARPAIQDGKNLVGWSRPYLASDSRIIEIVDPAIRDSIDFDQLKKILNIVQWCTQHESHARPSIKQVLRLLYQSSEPINSGTFQDEEIHGGSGG